MPGADSSGDKPEKKRGPKGGIKHQPGKGHDRKSAPARKKRFAKKPPPSGNGRTPTPAGRGRSGTPCRTT